MSAVTDKVAGRPAAPTVNCAWIDTTDWGPPKPGGEMLLAGFKGRPSRMFSCASEGALVATTNANARATAQERLQSITGMPYILIQQRIKKATL
jgi:hypothetical protein